MVKTFHISERGERASPLVFCLRGSEADNDVLAHWVMSVAPPLCAMLSSSARRAGLGVKGPMLGLRDFMHRSRVLSLYRAFMRELHGVDTNAVVEMRRSVREAFRRNAGDRAGSKGHLAEGERQLQFVKSYVSTARVGVQMGSSWVGTGEAFDQKGRLGDGWPWAKT